MIGLYEWLVQSLRTNHVTTSGWFTAFRLDQDIWSWRRIYTAKERRRFSWKHLGITWLRLLGWAFALATTGLGGLVLFLAGKGWREEPIAVVWFAVGIATASWLFWQWSSRWTYGHSFPSVWHALPLTEQEIQGEERDIWTQSTEEVRAVLARAVDVATRRKKREVGVEEIWAALLERSDVANHIAPSGVMGEHMYVWLRTILGMTYESGEIHGWSVSGRGVLVGAVLVATARGCARIHLVDLVLGACVSADVYEIPPIGAGLSWYQLAQGCWRVHIKGSVHKNTHAHPFGYISDVESVFSWKAWQEFLHARQAGKAICFVGDQDVVTHLCAYSFSIAKQPMADRGFRTHSIWDRVREWRTWQPVHISGRASADADYCMQLSRFFSSHIALYWQISNQEEVNMSVSLFTHAAEQGHAWYAHCSTVDQVPASWRTHKCIRIIQV